MSINVLAHPQRPAASETAPQAPVRVPPIDVIESASAYGVIIDMPGVGPGDLELTVENDVLNISANAKATAPEGFTPVEGQGRGYRYQRRLLLPETVDRSAITAEIRNGVLRLTLSKAAEAQPRRIEVKGA